MDWSITRRGTGVETRSPRRPLALRAPVGRHQSGGVEARANHTPQRFRNQLALAVQLEFLQDRLEVVAHRVGREELSVAQTSHWLRSGGERRPAAATPGAASTRASSASQASALTPCH
jgi:hypothetical protein